MLYLKEYSDDLLILGFDTSLNLCFLPPSCNSTFFFIQIYLYMYIQNCESYEPSDT